VRTVESLPEHRAQQLLPGLAAAGDDAGDEA
jgi:hypothetical protein